MTGIEWLVTIGGFALSIFVGWFFWFSKREGTTASVSEEGVQEIFMTVKGGYTPDLILVKVGKPVKLHVTRKETAVCSELLMIPDFALSKKLPQNELVTFEFVPKKLGEHDFSCQMGMYRGKLVVTD